MSQRTIIRCDRRSCQTEVEVQQGVASFAMNIRGVNYDLCPACARAHRAFMIGVGIPENWAMLDAESQQRWLDEQAKQAVSR